MTLYEPGDSYERDLVDPRGDQVHLRGLPRHTGFGRSFRPGGWSPPVGAQNTVPSRARGNTARGAERAAEALEPEIRIAMKNFMTAQWNSALEDQDSRCSAATDLFAEPTGIRTTTLMDEMIDQLQLGELGGDGTAGECTASSVSVLFRGAANAAAESSEAEEASVAWKKLAWCAALQAAPESMPELRIAIDRKDACARAFDSGFFKVNSRQQAECYWNQGAVSLVGQANLDYRPGASTVSTELVSCLVGALRFALGGAIAETEASTETEPDSDDGASSPPAKADPTTVEKFFAAGGDAYLNMAWPIYNAGGPVTDFHVHLTALPRIGMLLPKSGTVNDNPIVSVDLASEFGVRVINPTTETFQIYANARVGWVNGSDQFYKSLGLTDESSF